MRICLEKLPQVKRHLELQFGHSIQGILQVQQRVGGKHEQERREDKVLSNTGVKPGVGEGGANTHALVLECHGEKSAPISIFELTHQCRTAEPKCVRSQKYDLAVLPTSPTGV